jgi:hypothetical protein
MINDPQFGLKLEPNETVVTFEELREHEVETEKALASRDATIRNLRLTIRGLRKYLDAARGSDTRARVALAKIHEITECGYIDSTGLGRINKILRESR